MMGCGPSAWDLTIRAPTTSHESRAHRIPRIPDGLNPARIEATLHSQKTGRGTPQLRCLDKHHSPRPLTNASRRARPDAGTCPSGFRDQGSGIRDPGSGIRDLGSGIRGQRSGIRDPGSGIRDPGSGIRDPGSRARDRWLYSSDQLLMLWTTAEADQGWGLMGCLMLPYGLPLRSVRAACPPCGRRLKR